MTAAAAAGRVRAARQAGVSVGLFGGRLGGPWIAMKQDKSCFFGSNNIS